MRFLQKRRDYPYNMSSMTQSPNQNGRVEKIVNAFLKAPNCCTMQCKGLATYVQAVEGARIPKERQHSLPPQSGKLDGKLASSFKRQTPVSQQAKWHNCQTQLAQSAQSADFQSAQLAQSAECWLFAKSPSARSARPARTSRLTVE